MMKSANNMSLVNRLVIVTSAVTTFLLAITFWYIIGQWSSSERDKIYQGINQVVLLESENIKNLMARGYKILSTSFHTPTVLNWLEKRGVMWEEVDGKPGYQAINAYLKKVVESEEVVTSLFYSPLKTREYWDENGRIPREIMTRPIEQVDWWPAATEHNGPVVAKPFADARTGIVSASIAMPVRNTDGVNLAIAGLDIPLSKIQQDITNKTKYEGQGKAFLFQSNGKLITLPNGGPASEKLQTLADLDKTEDDEGFKQLQNLQSSGQRFTVQFNGDPQVVTVIPVRMDVPLLDWRLALIYPQSEIDKPVKAASVQLVILAVLVILLVSLALYISLSRGLLPLQEIGEAMSNVVSGDGDLAQRLEVKRQDEIGRVAMMFNQFVGNIQSLVQRSVQVSEHVDSASKSLEKLITNVTSDIDSQNAEIDVVNSATMGLSNAVNEICNKAEGSSCNTQNAQENVKAGLESVTDANQQITNLAESVFLAEEKVMELEKSSDRIGEVVDVISGIAEQTNLLALNASIEAARAGDQGRGFAVVADEVRTLAHRTQESTSNIQNIINSFRSNTEQIMAVVVDNKKQAEMSVEHAGVINEQLKELNAQIIDIQTQTTNIAKSTSQQSTVLDTVSQNLMQIKDISASTMKRVHEAQDASLLLAEQSTQLQTTLSRFKV